MVPVFCSKSSCKVLLKFPVKRFGDVHYVFSVNQITTVAVNASTRSIPWNLLQFLPLQIFVVYDQILQTYIEDGYQFDFEHLPLLNEDLFANQENLRCLEHCFILTVLLIFLTPSTSTFSAAKCFQIYVPTDISAHLYPSLFTEYVYLYPSFALSSGTAEPVYPNYSDLKKYHITGAQLSCSISRTFPNWTHYTNVSSNHGGC